MRTRIGASARAAARRVAAVPWSGRVWHDGWNMLRLLELRPGTLSAWWRRRRTGARASAGGAGAERRAGDAPSPGSLEGTAIRGAAGSGEGPGGAAQAGSPAATGAASAAEDRSAAPGDLPPEEVAEVDDADILPLADEASGALPVALGLEESSPVGLLGGGAQPLPPPVLARVNLGLALSRALARVAFFPGVSVRRVGNGAPVLAEERLLEEALERLLRVAAAAMPRGGQLAVRASRREGEVVLEIGDTGAAHAARPELREAQRLLALQGGTLERLVAPGRGALSRVTLPAAPS